MTLGDDAVDYELSDSELDEVIGVHIHFGREGVNGGIIAFLCQDQGTPLGDPPEGVPPCPDGDQTITGTLTAVDVVGPIDQGIELGDGEPRMIRAPRSSEMNRSRLQTLILSLTDPSLLNLLPTKLQQTPNVMDCHDVVLSYCRNDLESAAMLRSELEKCGLSVFRDEDSIRASDLWLDRLQQAVDACGSFVLLVGKDGVRRWVGAEAQVALIRHFGPHDEAKRLPIYPILLGDATADGLPAFLRLFQATPWNGVDPLPDDFLGCITEGRLLPSKADVFEGCPFVGLDAYRPDQAELFFGRHKETLDALACFDQRSGHAVIRWLEINGNSGSGKSSLMNAGLLPLIDQGWLWARTRFEDWRRIGPLMPGERPVAMLAEHLARAFPPAEMADVRKRLEEGDEHALADWLRSRKPNDQTAFLLAIDQFEELFTFADQDERQRFDRLLARALADPDCPLFVISTVRSDFLDRFDAQLPELVPIRNRLAKLWTLPLIGRDVLRDVIDGPARLCGLNVDEVREAMLTEIQDEPGALPLLENALRWLWEQRRDGRLSGRLLTEHGGLAGILSAGADSLLNGLGEQRGAALELLFHLVKLDPEGRNHTRRRLPLAKALVIAGTDGRSVIDRLAGTRDATCLNTGAQLRLITVADEEGAASSPADTEPSVNLIHETLIRSRKMEEGGQPRPFWPTFWDYIEQNRGRAAAQDRARLLGSIVESEALAWAAAGLPENERWPGQRFQEEIREVMRVGLTLDDILRSDVARRFFGPAQMEHLPLLGLDETEDGASGSSRYGERWRLPWNHQARADFGDRLATLGDRRKGVGLRPDGLPDIDWCRIEGGEVSIEDEDVRPGRNRRAVAPFWSARYPITLLQYHAFVADCFRDGAWQLPDGVPLTGLDDPRVSSTEACNQPATEVSWYHANAFCHWLSACVGCCIRLPNESEWQLAATGGDPDNVYPWGPEWDPSREPWRANSGESGLGRSTAVGLYPLGATRQGVMDMAGTVWEWCANRYDAPDHSEFPEDRTTDHRVLRGGSWQLRSGLCALRRPQTGAGPNNRSGDVGFRVVCSSPIEDR